MRRSTWLDRLPPEVPFLLAGLMVGLLIVIAMFAV